MHLLKEMWMAAAVWIVYLKAELEEFIRHICMHDASRTHICVCVSFTMNMLVYLCVIATPPSCTEDKSTAIHNNNDKQNSSNSKECACVPDHSLHIYRQD